MHECSLPLAIGRRTLNYKRRLSIPENSDSPERFVHSMACWLRIGSLNIALASLAVCCRRLLSSRPQTTPPAACATSRYRVSPAYRGWLCARPGAKEIVKHQARCTATLEATVCSLRHSRCHAICRCDSDTMWSTNPKRLMDPHRHGPPLPACAPLYTSRIAVLRPEGKGRLTVPKRVLHPSVLLLTQLYPAEPPRPETSSRRHYALRGFHQSYPGLLCHRPPARRTCPMQMQDRPWQTCPACASGPCTH